MPPDPSLDFASNTIIAASISRIVDKMKLELTSGSQRLVVKDPKAVRATLDILDHERQQCPSLHLLQCARAGSLGRGGGQDIGRPVPPDKRCLCGVLGTRKAAEVTGVRLP